jgi:hypothetical protein
MIGGKILQAWFMSMMLAEQMVAKLKVESRKGGAKGGGKIQDFD